MTLLPSAQFQCVALLQNPLPIVKQFKKAVDLKRKNKIWMMQPIMNLTISHITLSQFPSLPDYLIPKSLEFLTNQIPKKFLNKVYHQSVFAFLLFPAISVSTNTKSRHLLGNTKTQSSSPVSQLLQSSQDRRKFAANHAMIYSFPLHPYSSLYTRCTNMVTRKKLNPSTRTHLPFSSQPN